MSNQSAKPPVIWLNVLVFAITFGVAAIGVPLYAMAYDIPSAMWWWMLASIGFAGFSITAGYHRLWAHKAYKSHAIMRFFYAIGGALALQNSALHWSSDHREHHKNVDHVDDDPYSAKRGFWYSHIGWMLREHHASSYNDYSNVKDLQKDRIVMWQHKYYLPLTLLMTIGWPIVLGVIYGDIWAALLVVGFLRLVINHHTTFFINSLAHMWGRQPYTDKNSARDNDILALFTFGEGYHNYHHIFSADYRNGIRWWQFDPTKWIIRCLSWFGLASDLRRCSGYQIERAKLEMHLKRYKEKHSDTAAADWMERIHDEYDALMQQLKAYYQARKALLDSKAKALKEQVSSSQLHHQFLEVKQRFEDQKREFKGLLRRQQPAM
ncbi:acyl-CoA desaturase [Idiomarina tyrosinivorans]|uniref:Acyl-CoA desaturase n=1 Tax=Idiomarina tyrosinivorans TaxID=1445662 RepID=A0A432ZQS8_9GAMM|nr:fatty acid desaturase [Idiomarina tyrosinivorans]RUO80202.1 acyl-CoA desaturase [Idiomarina tyrosinivorans]